MSWDQLSRLCPLPAFRFTPSLLTGGAMWEAEKALILCKHCSAITKTPLNYQHCFQYKFKTSPHACYYEENGLYPSQNQHTYVLPKSPPSTAPSLEKGLGDLWGTSVARAALQAPGTRYFIWDRRSVKWGGGCKVWTLDFCRSLLELLTVSIDLHPSGT